MSFYSKARMCAPDAFSSSLISIEQHFIALKWSGGVWKGSGEYERRLRLPSDMNCSFIIPFRLAPHSPKCFSIELFSVWFVICKEVCFALPHSVLCVNSLDGRVPARSSYLHQSIDSV